MLQTQINYGLSGQYSNFLGLGKKAKERREARREERQAKKEDRQLRTEERKEVRQEKRELANEKRRLKNDLKQAKVDEKNAQTNAVTQQLNTPVVQENKSYAGIIAAAIIGTMAIAGIGWFAIRKQNPGPLVMPAKITT